MAYADCVAIDDQRFPVPLYCARKNPVRGIESGQIRHGIQVGRFVDRDDLVFMAQGGFMQRAQEARSEEHTSELQSLMRISYAVFCLKKKTIQTEKRM